jgi:membrane protein DedA with SNARE-associated domain
MEDLFEKVRGYLEEAGSNPGLLEFLFLGLSSTLEYVFPPFPGDVVVLFGAFLVGRFGWSLPAVMIAVNAGSAVGLTVDYAFGLWVAKHDARWREKYPRWKKLGASLDRFDVFYRRWGPLCILLNRFLPAVRAVFFLAAGISGIKYWKVLLLGLISSVAWNFLLVWVGILVGHNWEKLRGFLRAYSTAAWILGGIVAIVLIVRYLRR